MSDALLIGGFHAVQAALERARAELPARQRADFQTLLVSVDPKRDTTAKMKTYVTYFDPTGRGVVIRCAPG